TILGAIFAVSFIRYKTIWPAIIAHFFLDFLNLFVPWFESLYQKIFG
ncbi:MAG TPA: CPBP family intramembrane metalloprotease, partial [candidate division Zixibacteria bacterium]|nr:CPBP family intramembrane metalloprotease [candidate division Zixibacteria bacterium]